MKVAIDVSSIIYGTGVSMYARELVKALARIDTENEYLLFAGTLRQRQLIQSWYDQAELGERFSFRMLPIPPKVQASLWNDLHVIRLEWLIGNFDLYHSLDWSLAPTTKPTVLTVHDLFFLKRPDLQLHPYAETLKRRLERARTDQLPVIAVSKSTKQDLIELLDYPESLITVIYEAATGLMMIEDEKKKYDELREKYQLPERYLVIVATQEPRKNLTRTIEAFGKLKRGDAGLVVVGKSGWGPEMGAQPGVIFTGYVSDEERQLLIQHAHGLVYPSLYEGFGLPILEAFQLQVPVLTSSISSMPEVAGEAAIFVDPFDDQSLQAGLETMISLTKKDRDRLITKGGKQLEEFTWDRAAQETLAVYQSVISEPGQIGTS